jgi:hypothetical protein
MSKIPPRIKPITKTYVKPTREAPGAAKQNIPMMIARMPMSSEIHQFFTALFIDSIKYNITS